MTRLDHFKAWAAAAVIRLVLAALAATWRFEVVRGGEHLEEIAMGRRRFVLCFWHNRAAALARFIHRRLLARGAKLTVLVSQSKDGEIGAWLARFWRAAVVRGSATRGGSSGLRQLYRAVTRDGHSALTIPDGPKGPLYVAKPGAIVLAQTCGVPLLPLACAADSVWTIRSWDRLIVPRLFARVWIVVGDPIDVPRELPGDAFETERLRLERNLLHLAEEVERHGVVPLVARTGEP